MFIVMNRFPVRLEFAEQFEARIRNRPRRVESQPGFVRAQLLRPVNSGDPYVVLTAWETKADFETWVNADTFSQKHTGPRTLSKEVFSGPNQVETFELILDSTSA